MSIVAIESCVFARAFVCLRRSCTSQIPSSGRALLRSPICFPMYNVRSLSNGKTAKSAKHASASAMCLSAAQQSRSRVPRHTRRRRRRPVRRSRGQRRRPPRMGPRVGSRCISWPAQGPLAITRLPRSHSRRDRRSLSTRCRRRRSHRSRQCSRRGPRRSRRLRSYSRRRRRPRKRRRSRRSCTHRHWCIPTCRR